MTADVDVPQPPARAGDLPRPAGPTHREALLVKLFGARRLTLGMTAHDRMWGWLGPLIVALAAGALRFWNLAHPHELVFDETYYVKDSWTLLNLGYSSEWPEEPNDRFEAGEVNIYTTDPAFVVHPLVGKMLIALGMALGGAENSFFWRLVPALAGTLMVFLLARVARRLFASTAMGIIAGGLMAVDGVGIVHARTALLDEFIMVFALIAFWCLLRDRDQARLRLADRVSAILDAGGDIGRYGPRLGWRWWRFAAAVSLGLAAGVKWSGLYFLAAFALLSVLWDASARRRVGIKRWWEDTFLVDAIPAALIMLPTALITYVASWGPWFATQGGYYRQWASEHPGEGVTWLPGPLRSLWEYHVKMYDFHTGLDSDHTYAASPWGWIIQARPTSFYYRSFAEGENGCTSSKCAEAITSLGNPILWWLGALALVATVTWLVIAKDWRATAVLAGLVGGWVPWLVTDRTIFTFYTIAFSPWVILAVVYVMTVLLERTEGRPDARAWVRWAIMATLIVIGGVSAFFYPIWTGWNVPYWFWHAHMWLQSWI